MKIDIETIESLRPDVLPLDPEWSNTALRSILADDAAPRRRPRSRLAARVAAVCVAVPVIGLGAAAATTGFSFNSLRDAFPYWGDGSDGAGVDLNAAQRLGTGAGPDGSVFSVVAASGKDTTCYVALFESQASAKQPSPTAFREATSNYCSDVPLYEGPAEFGVAGVDYDPDDLNGGNGYMLVAGNATSAIATGQDGAEYPTILAHGLFWGWFPRDEKLTVVGYAKDGSRVGELTVN